ncbi:hypothetical protein L873DRAFT_1815544 [Choiromyces venosus 120613-1]|uniref:Uncharacterized protein n=1 Tax=Choiromyces venosus 120613-1 TaxID=1336337 RepID=A0A3N4J5J4_9PEZI|nr:hypothetical protein L873DRAFT_1815544 [Choiromyces venosus 120613-1]
MQFTTLLATLTLAATAFAAPAPAADSSVEARAGAPSWEFHSFRDVSCHTSTTTILGGPQTPGSQCIDLTQRISGNIYSATSPQGCKVYAYVNGNTNCNGAPGNGALLSNTCSAYFFPITSIRVDC